MRTLEDAPFLDTLGPAFRDSPDRLIDLLRPQSWVVRTPLGGLVISRQHVQTLLGDRRLRSSLVEFIEMQGVTEGLLHDRMCTTLLAIEGPDHVRVRKLVRKAFMPAAVERHRPLMRTILEKLLEPVAGAEPWEFMGAVADHYPIEVMCHVLGIRPEDHENITAWTKAIAWSLSLELAAHIEEAEQAMRAMDDYVGALVSDRRIQPCDDLVTDLVKAEEAGDRLSDGELRSLIVGLLFAGYDTTRNQLGLAVWAFARHPHQWRLLAEDPELAPAAVEESLRYRGSVALAPRLVAEDFEFDGYRFAAGTLLNLSTAAANHDPAMHDHPGAFDISVSREAQLSFGGGPHFCLGAGLARAEMQEALPMLTRALPTLLLDREPTWGPPIGITGPETLWVRSGSLAHT